MKLTPTRTTRRGQLIKQIPVIFGIMVAGTLFQGCGWTGKTYTSKRESHFYAKEILRSMGGVHALRGIRNLRFDFVIEDDGREILRRKHWWNRTRGSYRLEGRYKGHNYVARFNLSTLQGKISRTFDSDGREIYEDDAELIDFSYRCHVNDSYWLLSPAKLQDTGTILKYEGVRPSALGDFRTLRLTLKKGTALAPEDQYWFYLPPDTWRPVGWTFVLQDEVVPHTYRWTKWKEVRGLHLPVRFEHATDTRVVRIENLHSPEDIIDVYQFLGRPR